MTAAGVFDFSYALYQLKLGQRLSRNDWNGQDQYVVMMPGYANGIGINEVTARATRLPVGYRCKFNPYFLMKNEQDEFVPWVPSTGDLLAETWYLVEDGE